MTLRALQLVVALTSGAAAASCALFRGAAFPAEGSVVPPNPTFFVQVETPSPPGGMLERFRVDAKGQRDVLSMSPLHELWLERPTTQPVGTALPFTLTLVATAEGVDTYRLDVRAAEGERFVVHPFHTRPVTVGKAAPHPAAPVISLGELKTSAWTCSYEATRAVKTSFAAPAWRVRWAASEGALGPASPFIIATAGDDAGLVLGHRNCRGFNLRWSTPIVIEVTALLADGTESKPSNVLRLPRLETEEAVREATRTPD